MHSGTVRKQLHETRTQAEFEIKMTSVGNKLKGVSLKALLAAWFVLEEKKNYTLKKILRDAQRWWQYLSGIVLGHLFLLCHAGHCIKHLHTHLLHRQMRKWGLRVVA